MSIRLIASLPLIMMLFSSLALADNIKIQKAKYKESKQLLVVKGKLDKYQHNKSHHHNKHSAKSIEIVDANNPSFVLAQQQAHKSFKAHISTTDLGYIPCQVGVIVDGDIDNMAYAQVRKAPDQCGGYSATITGLITDEPIPFATVTVTLNGQTFTTTADANGAYSLDILTTDVAQLLVIESSATQAETGDEINFVNMVGSFEKVLSETDPINVTNVTTASYALVVEANGGTEPTNVAELQAAETSVDATELFELAAVIKLIVDDPNYSLPAGYDSVLDFVNDQAAVETFVQATPTEDIDGAVAAILADSDLVAGFSADDIPELYYVTAVAQPGYMARTGSALEFDASNNTGNALEFQSYNGIAINEVFTWAVDNGRLVVTLSSPEQLEQLSHEIETVTDNQAEIDAFYAGGGTESGFNYYSTEFQRAYTRVVDGNLVDVVSVETRRELVTPDILLLDGSTLSIADPKLAIENSNQTLRSSLDVTPIAFDASCAVGGTCVEGAWGGIYHFSEGKRAYDDFIFPESAYGELITFAGDNSTSGEVSGVDASWQVDAEGKLVISYANGMVQTNQILEQSGIEYGVFSTFDNGAERYATYTIWVKADPSFALDVSYLTNLSGDHFWAGEINAWIPSLYDELGYLQPNQLWGWAFTPNDVTNTWGLQWSTPDANGLSSIEFTDAGPVNYVVNPSSLLIERSPFAKRYWYPIASTVIEGQRMFYIVEREERDAELWFGGEPGFNTFIPARINIERERSKLDYTNIAR
ncbi:carboxypeptidase-like regulatory domain-containing protein [Shewanella maritima]|uniref:carboxypeptidase-like regulatory domain-containing protein n=1 Tax=Shewanella maritima TaxID=2520507 RepID=UPI00373634AB